MYSDFTLRKKLIQMVFTTSSFRLYSKHMASPLQKQPVNACCANNRCLLWGPYALRGEPNNSVTLCCTGWQLSLLFGRSPAVTSYLLTYSMVQSPFWEANWLAASQEIPRIFRNPKVHYRTHKRPPPVSILGQPNPVHIHIQPPADPS